jgi:hypothetical protein
MENAKEATECHRNNKEFYLNNEQVEKALADSIMISDESIPTDRFGENKTINYAFGNAAKDYGLFLKDARIEKMSVHLCKPKDKPFANQMLFFEVFAGSCGLFMSRSGDCNQSGLIDGSRLLNYGHRVRGVRNLEKQVIEGAGK